MRNKNTCRVLMLLLAFSAGFAELCAQSAGFSLRGVVREGKDGGGLSYATVRAVSAADSA